MIPFWRYLEPDWYDTGRISDRVFLVETLAAVTVAILYQSGTRMPIVKYLYKLFTTSLQRLLACIKPYSKACSACE